MPNDIVLTGVPRSGTTLACFLLNKLPDVVALHEPIPAEAQFKLDGGKAVLKVAREYFGIVRESISERGMAPTRHVEGQIPDSHVPEQHSAGELRKDPAQWGEIPVDKPLSRDFALVFKHPTMFTGGLEALMPHYPCYAIVRNPLAVLGSWNSVEMRFRTGRVPAAERLDPKLSKELASIADDDLRQIRFLRWFFDRYSQSLPRERVLRYEDTITSGGTALKVILPAAAELQEPLASKNSSKVYDGKVLIPLGRKLLQTEGSFWNYYRREDVAELLAVIEASQ